MRELVSALGDLIARAEPAILRLWRSAGLTFSQRRLLRQLRNGPRGAGDLAAAAGLSAPSLTRMVARLEQPGYLRRELDASDRRRITIALTERGEQVLAGHRVFREAGLVDAVRRLDPQARIELTGRLRELLVAAGPTEEPIP